MNTSTFARLALRLIAATFALSLVAGCAVQSAPDDVETTQDELDESVSGKTRSWGRANWAGASRHDQENPVPSPWIPPGTQVENPEPSPWVPVGPGQR